MEMLSPQSVVDVGCGTGTFLHVFENHGVKKILGLDGDWVNREQLAKNISPDKFMVVDLEKGIDVDEKFDLAVCLEVLEHLGEEYADNVVKSLTQLSNIILFSAAIPGQPGQNHVNGQWPEYWIQQFKVCGFSFHDVLRPVFWDNKDLAWWYKQNMFLVVKNESENPLKGFADFQNTGMKAIVHPDTLGLEVQKAEELSAMHGNLLNQYHAVMKGKASFKTYIKLIAKYILGKLSLYK